MDPAAMAGMGADQLGGMTAAAMGGFDGNQMGGLTKDAIGGISADQFSALSGDALGGLKSENLGGLGADVISNMSIADIENLDPTEVKGMAGEDFSKLVTNMNEFSVAPDTVATLLPEGWAIDATGDLTAPPGAGLSFQALPEAAPPAAGEPTVAALPDLSTSLALGAGSGAPSVLTGMGSALTAAGAPGLAFSQTKEGVLNIGSGDSGAPVAAFIPDAANMVQAAADAVPGVSVDALTGGYVIVTPEGYQIPLLPSISNPAEVASLLPDSEVVIGAGGQTSISNLTGTDGTTSSIAGIANPILITDDRPAGAYTDGTGVDAVVTIVYADGSAQTLSPTIQDQDEFEAAAAAIPGVTDLALKLDGSISLSFDDIPINLKPMFDVVKGVPGVEVTPGISNEDGRFFFTSANGDKQEFAVAPS